MVRPAVRRIDFREDSVRKGGGEISQQTPERAQTRM